MGLGEAREKRKKKGMGGGTANHQQPKREKNPQGGEPWEPGKRRVPTHQGKGRNYSKKQRRGTRRGGEKKNKNHLQREQDQKDGIEGLTSKPTTVRPPLTPPLGCISIYGDPSAAYATCLSGALAFQRGELSVVAAAASQEHQMAPLLEIGKGQADRRGLTG